MNGPAPPGLAAPLATGGVLQQRATMERSNCGLLPSLRTGLSALQLALSSIYTSRKIMTIATVAVDLAMNVRAVYGIDEADKPALVRREGCAPSCSNALPICDRH